ncbi:MAG: tripartite tricarboxylate transporter substrate binding protein [Comamonadaceae bacterium]|nr:MAG: tripartite tricarboxylate transporter substrate binding protein [Comamonadaceae bacterium]
MTTLSSQAINPHLYASLRFDPAKSFAPIILVAKYPLLLMTPPQLKLNSVPDFVAYARANRGKLNFSSAGNGSPAHLAGEIFKTQARVEATHVHYKGGGPAMMAVMANEVQFAFETIPSGIGYVKGGKLKGLAVTSSERSGAAPDLPTLREVGMKDLSITSWAGLVAPAGTPSAVLERLSAAAQSALTKPSVRAALAADGAEPGGGSANDFARFMADEHQAWGKVVRLANASVN